PKPKPFVRRLLFAGTCDGDLQPLYTRIAAVHKSKGPLDVCFCVGKFMSDTNAARMAPFMANGSIKCDIPLFFLDQDSTAFHKPHMSKKGFSDGMKVTDNLHYIGGCGIK
ncbi:unnamed protein product, partial [Amoebophrya sp. A120]